MNYYLVSSDPDAGKEVAKLANNVKKRYRAEKATTVYEHGQWFIELTMPEGSGDRDTILLSVVDTILGLDVEEL